MKNLIKIEELFLFGLALFLFSGSDYGWGWYAFLFFAPDLSMVGYLANPRVGAWTYNLIHYKGVAVALYVMGSLLSLYPLVDVRRDAPARSLQLRSRLRLRLEIS
jgi:uncharacterized protein DUF4260